ncbi:MAG: hypothetical protein L6R40_003582 [Gallowayella cf. fulva]|nr:MAG: hypothetical protein L6R40_003582 [Xanthomendoza cf. fulva]
MEVYKAPTVKQLSDGMYLWEMTKRRKRRSDFADTPTLTPSLEIAALDFQVCGGGLYGTSPRSYPRDSMQRMSKDGYTCRCYITNLAQTLFEDQYLGTFCLRQHIIYHCFDKDQPWPSEILLTRLAQGYVTNEGGFTLLASADSDKGF